MSLPIVQQPQVLPSSTSTRTRTRSQVSFQSNQVQIMDYEMDFHSDDGTSTNDPPDSPRLCETTAHISSLTLAGDDSDDDNANDNNNNNTSNDNNNNNNENENDKAKRTNGNDTIDTIENKDKDKNAMVEVVKQEGEALIKRKTKYEREVLSEKRKSQIRGYKHREQKEARLKRRIGREQSKINISSENGVDKKRQRTRSVRFAV